MTTTDGLVATTHSLARSALWALASTLFRYPEEGDANDARDPEIWRIADRGARTLGRPSLLRAVQRARGRFLGLPRTELERAFTTAFGHSVRGAIPLYETEWGISEGLLQPHELADLSAFYRAHGLRPVPQRDRADHMAMECEFMHFLAYKEAYAGARENLDQAQLCRETASRFLHDHLARFAPAFVRRCVAAVAEGPYADAAELLIELIRAECGELLVRAGDEELPLRTTSYDEETSCMTCELGSAGAGRTPR